MIRHTCKLNPNGRGWTVATREVEPPLDLMPDLLHALCWLAAAVVVVAVLEILTTCFGG